MKTISRLPSQARGFSLAETAIAVAIASLGLLAIMGLLPQGLELSRKTGNLAAETRILQQITGEVQQTDWVEQTTVYPTGNLPNRFYDDQGVLLDGSNDMKVAYVARVEVPTGAITMPGSKDAKAHPYLRNVVVKVGSVPNRNFDFGQGNQARYKTHILLIAKTN